MNREGTGLKEVRTGEDEHYISLIEEELLYQAY